MTLLWTFNLLRKLSRKKTFISYSRKLSSRGTVTVDSKGSVIVDNIDEPVSLTGKPYNSFIKMATKSDTREANTTRLFVMRHGERCDFSFGKSWVKECFDKEGKYTQLDLNLPASVPSRNPEDFLQDSSLTSTGSFQAHLTGEALKNAGIDIKHVYVSPALRSIQTAQSVVDGMGNGAELRIEPSAFEWLGWYKTSPPRWMEPAELVQAGFSISQNHKPFVQLSELTLGEDMKQYYGRCHALAAHLTTQHAGEDVLVVGHAGSLDTMTRQLLGRQPRSLADMQRNLHAFPYCCLCMATQRQGQWALDQPPVPPLMGFDWRMLNN